MSVPRWLITMSIVGLVLVSGCLSGDGSTPSATATSGPGESPTPSETSTTITTITDESTSTTLPTAIATTIPRDTTTSRTTPRVLTSTTSPTVTTTTLATTVTGEPAPTTTATPTSTHQRTTVVSDLSNETANTRALAAEEEYLRERLRNATCLEMWGTEPTTVEKRATVINRTTGGVYVEVTHPFSYSKELGRTDMVADGGSNARYVVTSESVRRVRGDTVSPC